MGKHTPGVEIPGIPGYTVTRTGKVYSVKSNWRGYGIRELNQTLNSYGYPSVRIYVKGKRKHLPVHRLVAKTFLCKPPSADQLRHLDGDRTNSHVENLAWGTAQDNANDRERHGRTSRGKRHSRAIRKGLAINV